MLGLCVNVFFFLFVKNEEKNDKNQELCSYVLCLILLKIEFVKND